MYELFVFLLKAAVVLFNIVFYLTLTQDDGDSNWVFPKIPWFDDRMNWLEKEHKPIYWIITCFLVPIVFLYSILPLILAAWVFNL